MISGFNDRTKEFSEERNGGITSKYSLRSILQAVFVDGKREIYIRSN